MGARQAGPRPCGGICDDGGGEGGRQGWVPAPRAPFPWHDEAFGSLFQLSVGRNSFTTTAGVVDFRRFLFRRERAVGCWLLALGCWLLAVGGWLVVGLRFFDGPPRETNQSSWVLSRYNTQSTVAL
jgi:hypothetical protein